MSILPHGLMDSCVGPDTAAKCCILKLFRLSTLLILENIKLVSPGSINVYQTLI